MEVSIVIPIVRPESAKRTIELSKKNHGIDGVEIVAEEDSEEIGCPKKVRELVARAKHDLICFLGDDTLPQKGFLYTACHAWENKLFGFGLVGFNDLSERILPTHWLADKNLLKALGGEFFHTGYHHCCCDIELMERAIELGAYCFCRDAVVKHDHPIFTGKRPDEHYIKAYQYQKEDRALLIERRKKGWPNA